MFSSTDVYLVSALSSLGFRPTKSSIADNRVTFYWDDPQVKDCVDKYYNRLLAVDARSYADEIRSIKTILHNK